MSIALINRIASKDTFLKVIGHLIALETWIVSVLLLVLYILWWIVGKVTPLVWCGVKLSWIDIMRLSWEICLALRIEYSWACFLSHWNLVLLLLMLLLLESHIYLVAILLLIMHLGQVGIRWCLLLLELRWLRIIWTIKMLRLGSLLLLLRTIWLIVGRAIMRLLVR